MNAQSPTSLSVAAVAIASRHEVPNPAALQESPRRRRRVEAGIRPQSVRRQRKKKSTHNRRVVREERGRSRQTVNRGAVCPLDYCRTSVSRASKNEIR